MLVLVFLSQDHCNFLDLYLNSIKGIMRNNHFSLWRVSHTKKEQRSLKGVTSIHTGTNDLKKSALQQMLQRQATDCV